MPKKLKLMPKKA